MMKEGEKLQSGNILLCARFFHLKFDFLCVLGFYFLDS